MYEFYNTIENLENNHKVLIIKLIKQLLKTIISETNIKLKTYRLEYYKNTISRLIAIAGIKAGISDSFILKKLQKIIFLHTVRGYLFPESLESLVLELIQILEFTCVSFHTT